MRPLLVLFAGLVLCACSKRESSPDPSSVQKPSPQPVAAPAPGAGTNASEKSTVETAIDGFTGRTAVRAGRKAQSEIRAVVGERDADMKEVEGFERKP